MSNAIALRARGPQVAEGPTINPFSSLNELVNAQRGMVETQNLQLQQQGNLRFGQIMAQAPDYQTGVNAALSDPLAAPYAAQAIANVQSALHTQRDINASVTTETQNGHQAILKSIASTDDPDLARRMAIQQFSLLSPEAQKREGPAFLATLTGITGGTQGQTPAQASASFQQQRAAFGIATGMTPDVVKAVNGIPPNYTQEVTLPSGQKLTVQVPTPIYPGGPTAGPQVLNPMTGTVESPAQFTQPGVIPPTGAPPPVAPPPGTVPAGPGATGAALVSPPAPGVAPGTPPAVPVAAPGPDGAPAPGGTPTTDQVVPAPGGATPTPPAGVTPIPAPGTPAAPGGGLVAPPPQGLAPGFVRGPMGAQTREQAAYQEAEGKRKVDTYNTMQAAVGAAADEIPKLADGMNLIQDTTQGFLSGPGAGARQEAASAVRAIGSAMGFDSAKLQEWSNTIQGGSQAGMDALSKSQEFQALIRSYAVNQLKQAATGTGRVMLPEVEAFMKAIDINMTPQALNELINGQGRLALQRGYDRINKWNTFSQGVRDGSIRADIGDFRSWYAQNAPEAWKLPTQTAGGLKIGPRDPSTSFGGPSTPTSTYVPGQGIVPNAPAASAPATPAPMPPPNALSPPQVPIAR